MVNDRDLDDLYIYNRENDPLFTAMLLGGMIGLYGGFIGIGIGIGWLIWGH